MSAWTIRLARPEDADSMSQIENDAARLFAREPSLEGITLPPSRSPRAYRDLIAQRRCIVAVSGEEVVGFAACRPHGGELHLHELSVATEHQRHGIGRRLLYAVEADARTSSFRAITLDTFRDIAWNAPFYARHGFVEVHDLAAHPRLSAALESAVEAGLPRERRCAMIKFLA